METTFRYKLQTFFMATIVATILSGCASVINNDQVESKKQDSIYKSHTYKSHNYTFDY